MKTLSFIIPSIMLLSSAMGQEPTAAPSSYKKKDIEFENRVVENAKRAPLDTSFTLNSVKGQPDLHKKRSTYSVEIEKTLSAGGIR